MIVLVLESAARNCFLIRRLIIFESVAFTTCTEQKLSIRIIATSPQIFQAKSVNTSFVNIAFCCLFSSEEVFQGLSKNNSTKKQIEAEIQVTLKHAPAQKYREETIIHRLLLQITKLSYKLTLLASK